MKHLICIYIALLSAGVAMAQRNAATQTQYRTDVSLREQLKGSSIPGHQYRNSGMTSATKAKGDRAKESRGLQIRNNAEPGKAYKSSGNKGTAAPAAAASTNRSALPSDKKAEPAPQQPLPEMPKNLTQ